MGSALRRKEVQAQPSPVQHGRVPLPGADLLSRGVSDRQGLTCSALERVLTKALDLNMIADMLLGADA